MSVLPKGMQWKAHDKADGQAARRRIRQRMARHRAISDCCQTEMSLAKLRPFKTDPDGALLLVEDLALGHEARLICTDCLAEFETVGEEPHHVGL